MPVTLFVGKEVSSEVLVSAVEGRFRPTLGYGTSVVVLAASPRVYV